MKNRNISGAMLRYSDKSNLRLRSFLNDLDIFQLNYNWLISDFFGLVESQKIDELFTAENSLISGTDLTNIVVEENFQWVWGVLSGFDATISQAEVLSYDIPYADGYTGFWKNPLTIQHPLAETEIVIWDGLLILFISKQEQYVKQFREKFPLAEDLETYNSNNPNLS